MDSFANNIKAGKVKEVLEAMTDVENILMNTSIAIRMGFHTKKYIPIGPLQIDFPNAIPSKEYEEVYAIPSKEYEEVELLLTPFQLAIISTREEIVRLFLNKVLELIDEKPGLLAQLIEHKIKIDYNNQLINMFDKDDRSLDGMNSIHLAARFDHLCLNEIIETMNLHMSEETVLQLIHKPTNHLLITPLHLAVQRSLSFSTR